MEKKRFLSLILSVLMLVTLILPINAFAEEYEELIYEEPAYEEYYEEPAFDEFTYEEPVYEESLVEEPVFEDLTEEEFIVEGEENIAQVDDDKAVNEENAFFELFDTTTYDAGTAIEIINQPENAKGNVGDNVSFTVDATGVSSYQWQYSKTGTGSWKNCGEASAKSATLEVTNIADSTKALYFRCVLTGTDGTTQYTDVVRIEDAGLTIINQPENAKGNVGDNVSFTVDATGVSSYQWQYSKTGTGNWKNCGEASAKSATLEVTNIADSTKALYFRCKLTGTDGTTEYTNVVRIENANIVSEPFVFKIIEGTNNLTLIAYTGNASNVEVPGSVNGMTVTEIGVSPLADGEKGVFEGNTTLTSIKLPNTITAIREKSFKGCTNLSTMTTY